MGSVAHTGMHVLPPHVFHTQTPSLTHIQHSSVGGRDRNGGSIIVIQGTPQMEYKTLEIGKVLSYLMRIPP